MKEINGIVVNKIERDEINNKPWKYLIESKELGRNIWCNTFNEVLSKSISIGDSISIEIDENKFNNILNVLDHKKGNTPDIKTFNGLKPASTTLPNTPPIIPFYEKHRDDRDDKKQVLIVRQNALTNANALMANLTGLGFSKEEQKKLMLEGDPVEVLLNFAKRLEKWVMS